MQVCIRDDDKRLRSIYNICTKLVRSRCYFNNQKEVMIALWYFNNEIVSLFVKESETKIEEFKQRPNKRIIFCCIYMCSIM